MDAIYTNHLLGLSEQFIGYDRDTKLMTPHFFVKA